jgi:hypothetical protein
MAVTNPAPSPPTRRGNLLYWRLCCVGAIVCSLFTFTPLVIPAGQHTPMLLGLPFTLWSGIGVAFALVLLTLAGARVHPRIESAPREGR